MATNQRISSSIRSNKVLKLKQAPLLLILLLFVVGNVQGVKIRNQAPPDGGFQRRGRGRSLLLKNVRPSVSSTDNSNNNNNSNNARNLQQECNLNEDQEISSRIVIDVYGEPGRLSNAETNLIGTSILQTYNEIVSCGVDDDDDNFRTLNQVQLTTNLADFEDYGNATVLFSLAYTLVGTCRGCDATAPLFLPDRAIPDSCPCRAPGSSIFMIIANERIENFINNREIQSIYFFDTAAEIEVLPAAQCPDLTQFTTSNIVVGFFGCPLELDESELTSLADIFLRTYNRINGGGATDTLSAQRCDPFFRQVVSAQAFLEDDFEVDFGRLRSSAGTTMGGRRRYLTKELNDQEDDAFGGSMDDNVRRVLQDDVEFFCPFYFEIRFDVTVECRGCNISTATLFDEEEDVNYFESFDDDFNFFEYDDDAPFFGNGTFIGDDVVGGDGDDSFVDDSFVDDSFVDDSFVDDSFVDDSFVDDSFVDDSFGDDFSGDDSFGDDSFGDDFFNRRRLVKSDGFRLSGCQPNKPSTHRRMQSACHCPIDPFGGYRAVTEEEMIDAFNLILGFDFNLDLPNLVVEDVIEVEEIECDPNVDTLGTTIAIFYATDKIDSMISDEVVNQLSANLVRSYNDLAERFCDLQFRDVKSAIEVERTVTEARRWRGRRGRELQTGNRRPSFPFNFDATFFIGFRWSVSGSCRGCANSNSNLFNDAARRLEGQEARNPMKVQGANKYRRMQDGAQCYCAAVNFVDGAPTEREFSERYSTVIQGLTSILGDNYAIANLEEEVDISAPTTPPRVECTVALECVAAKSGKLCVNSECVNMGNPRVTLTWTGDDDLDLSVFTPNDDEIWYQEPFDTKTKGVFDTSYVQDVFAPHAESIYFPRSGAPGGTYGIAVYDYEERNGPDEWKVEVFVNDVVEPFFVQTGQGFQDDIRFTFGDFISGADDVCSVNSPHTECCVDQECTGGEPFDQLCVNRQCVSQGSPRFTLSYFGNDNYDLVVLTPGLELLDVDFNPLFDDVGEGAFEADKNAGILENTFHTENVFFMPGSPFGEYVFFVDSIETTGVRDEWRVEAAFGEESMVKTGSGFSSGFSFFLIECSSDKQCLPNESCVSESCVLEGTPRFTLTWEGNDDLDIYVVTPAGEKINFEAPFDEHSLGTLEGDSDMSRRINVESVFFEVASAPEGDYVVGVDSYTQRDVADLWNLTVNVKGTSRRAWTNQVGSQKYEWSYAGADTKTMTPVVTPSFFCFSGEMTVLTEGGGEILMKNLQLGDKIATSSSSFEPVYSFGHRKESLEASFLLLSPSKLEISTNHIIFIDGGHAVPASSLQVGDRLIDGQIITDIQQLTRTGVYAPFTPSGKLLVNGVHVSSYVAFQGSEYLSVGSADCVTIQTPFTYQWLAHTFEAPHRFWCTHITKCRHEYYTEHGISTWVAGPHRLAQWWLQSAQEQDKGDFVSNTFVLLFSVFSILPFILVFSTLVLLDTCMSYPWLITTCMVVTGWFLLLGGNAISKKKQAAS